MENYILVLLISHFVGDFLLQSDKMALNKYKDPYWLLAHILVYTTILFIFSFMFLDFKLSLSFNLFIYLNFMLHFSIDVITSQFTHFLYEKKENHWFFVVIGFDQLLHYFCLFVTYDFVNKI